MTNQITLNRQNLDKLANFMRERDVKQFFIAKDQGAYLGATAGEGEDFENCIFYFAGCDPRKDADYYETSRYKFGGDDFGEMLPAKIVTELADNPLVTKAVFKVSAYSISVSTFERRA